MTLPQYRSSTEYREILRLLQRASTEKQNFVWQTLQDHRVIVNIAHLDIDFVAREVVITLARGEGSLNYDFPLYVKLDYRGSVFKITKYSVGQRGEIHFPFPEEIKTQELRVHSRTFFPAEKEKTISLKPSLGGHRDSGNALSVRVTDVSEFGFGLIVSEQNRTYIKNNPLLWITHLQRDELRYPVLAEVVHISSDSTTKKPKEIKVGIKLSGIISKEHYLKFLQ